MSNYYLILLWMAFFGILGIFVQMYKTEIIYGKEEWRMKSFWAIVLVVPLVIWTANRGYVIDTGAYMKGFADMPEVLNLIPEYMDGVEKDKGFYLASALIKCLLTTDVNKYFFIVGAVQAFLLFRMYRKYSMRYAVSFFLFIASTDYVSWMFNGIRQFVAVTITLFAFESIIEKKYVKAIFIIIFASFFHQSALLVIPFVFIVQGEAWNIKTLLFIAAIIAVVSSVEQFTSLLDTALQETQYVNVVSDWTNSTDDGTNLLRVLVYGIPTIFSFIGLRFIRKEDDEIINICTNMSIVSLGFYVISMFTSGIFIGRLPIYFSLYNYILLPWEIEHIFEEKSAKIINIAMILAYIGFYYFQVHMVWGFA